MVFGILHYEVAHEVHYKLTEDDGELIPRNKLTAHVAWSNFGYIHRADGRG